jgi:hypothetical protein
MRKSVLLVSSLVLIAMLGFQKHSSAQGMFVPTAYGAWGNTVYGGMSIVSPGLYGQDEDGQIDGHAAIGFGLGNLVKNFGLQTQINRYAVVYGDRWSASAQVSRYLGKGVAIGFGADNFVRWGSNRVPFSPASWYISVSQKLKYVKPEGFASRLGYTLGIGTGRFGSLSQLEIDADQGVKYYKTKNSATLFYGALSVDILKWLEADVEWSGRNLHAGLALNFKTWKLPTRIIAGAADLTKFTGDGTRFFAGLGFAYQFKDVKYVELDTKKLEEKMDKAHKECMDKVDDLKKDHEQILANQKAMQDRLDNLEKQVQDVQNVQKALTDDANTMNSKGTKKDFAADGSNLKDGGNGEYVVVYSRRSLEEASALSKKLEKKGKASEITTNNTKSWYHVYTHLFSTQQHKDALKKSSDQRRNGYVGAWVLVK